jgi:hypothetical protein
MIGGIKHVLVNDGHEARFLELFRTLKAEMTRHEPLPAANLRSIRRRKCGDSLALAANGI